MKRSINIKIAGAAGEGIKSVGLMLSKSFVKAGYFTFDYMEYPSLIRGGHNTYQANISNSPIWSQAKKIDILICLNKQGLKLHKDELKKDSLVIFDPETVLVEAEKPLEEKKPANNGLNLTIPLKKIATDAGGLPIMANLAGLGAVMFLTGMDIKYLFLVIKQNFSKKGQEMVEQNQKVAALGFEFAERKYSDHKIDLQEASNKQEKILLTGNEAISLGAIAGGMKFYSAYPMTPATSILHYLASKAKEQGLVVKHAEDEISVINMALGASFAGVRVMTATSGGGFALMSEALGIAGIMELPIVIVEGMRTGPSSGMPTWHDQGDLNFVLYASQGEFPRMIISPGDVEENFYLTKQAFYFAEKYQLPVIILTDKYMAESLTTIKLPESVSENEKRSFNLEPVSPFERYKDSENGISLRTIPGQDKGVYLSNSYEHDLFGFATEEIEMRNLMVEKRLRKFETLKKEVCQIKQHVLGDPDAEIGIVSWGSNKGPIVEALKILEGKGTKASCLNLNVIWPFPEKQVVDYLSGKKFVIDIECNSTAQLAGLIRQHTGIEIKERLLKYDGRPFYPEEIVTKLAELN